MPNLTVVTRDGTEKSVSGEEGLSVMEVIRDNGFDELLALCGGCCSCATCHVHVDEQWLAALSPMDEDEDELLDSSDARQANSRLSCQLPFTAALDGMRVRIAPED
jgi:2Fe-2S ferredoxin